MRASASTLSISALVFIFTLTARDEARQIISDPAGLTTTQTNDLSGWFDGVTDSRGHTTYLAQNSGRATASTRDINTQTSTASQSLAAATIHVPTDYATIQAAIDAANNGDTVLVEDGTYKENINFNGKAITITSVHGASKTTLDGGAAATVVLFVTNETAASVLNGFTITNGASGFQSPNAGAGGGIAVLGSSPTITNNVIRANKACTGGGIGIVAGGPLIQGNIISNNAQGGCTGGSGGGGILISGASSNTRILGNVIANNVMPSGGGGITLSSAPTIKNNIIQGNDGGGMGGGLLIFNQASPKIVQNLFIGNKAVNGGGIYWVTPVGSPGLLLLNNTIAGNSSGNGSAIFDNGYDTNMTIENNLVIGKTGQSAYFCQQLNRTTKPAVFAHNDVFATGAAAMSGNCTFTTGTNGNLSAVPKFVSVAANNYHLQSGSPAVDAGTSSGSLPVNDLDGFPRVKNGIVDMGAYEFFPTTISLQPSSLAFPTQLTGTKSTPRPVVVTNSGTMPLFLGVTITGDFVQTNNCLSTIAPGGSCTVNVSFKPTAEGTRTGALLFADNASASPQNVPLSGTGQGFPIVSLSTTSLTFGVQVLATTSASQSVVLKNTGTAALTISSIVVSSDFAIPTKTCGSSLAPQTSCTIAVAFKPTAVGVRNGTLTINDSASGSPHAVSLSGTGTAVTLSPTALNFSPQLLGTVSAGRSVSVTNHSSMPLNLTAITMTGTNASDFVIASKTCGSSLSGNTTCTVTVEFRPSLIGPESAKLNFVDDGGASPQIAPMTGHGTVVTVSPSSITFPSQALGTTSAPQSVTLTNHGTTAVHINSVSIVGTNAADFPISFNSCPSDLVTSATCTVSVEFQPIVTGARTASLAFSDNGGASPQLIKLTGTGQ